MIALPGVSLGVGSGRAYGGRGESFRDLIARDIAAGMAPGVVVMAMRRGETLVHEAFGLARANPEVAMRADAVFDIASLTKVVAAATACAVCIDDGLVSLDAPLGRYLPGVEGAARNICIRDLASHMSGFDNDKSFLTDFLKGEDPVLAIQRARPVRPPGEMYRYACINFMLMGLVVEEVSGLRLDEFCRRRLFGPLGMKDTSFGPVDGSDQRVVKMVNADPGVISDEPARAARRPLGNAGLFSTATDLCRFAGALLGWGPRAGTCVLSSDAVRLFGRQLNHPPHHPRSFGWDLGLELRPSGMSGRAYYHTGWTGQSLYLDPELGVCVVVLSSRTGNHDLAKIQRMEIAASILAEMAA